MNFRFVHKVDKVITAGKYLIGACQDNYPDIRILVSSMDQIGESGIHRQGQRIFALRTIKTESKYPVIQGGNNIRTGTGNHGLILGELFRA
jgi:hypothetical protein